MVGLVAVLNGNFAFLTRSNNMSSVDAETQTTAEILSSSVTGASEEHSRGAAGPEDDLDKNAGEASQTSSSPDVAKAIASTSTSTKSSEAETETIDISDDEEDSEEFESEDEDVRDSGEASDSLSTFRARAPANFPASKGTKNLKTKETEKEKKDKEKKDKEQKRMAGK